MRTSWCTDYGGVLWRVLVPCLFIAVLSAATCSIPNPDSMPLARNMSPKEFSTLSQDYQWVQFILRRPTCALGLHLDPKKLLFAAQWAIFVRHDGPQCSSHQGLIGWVPPNSSVVVLCPRYWELDSISRITLLIHELAHVAGAEHAPNPEASKAYSDLVFKSCIQQDQQ